MICKIMVRHGQIQGVDKRVKYDSHPEGSNERFDDRVPGEDHDIRGSHMALEGHR